MEQLKYVIRFDPYHNNIKNKNKNCWKIMNLLFNVT